MASGWACANDSLLSTMRDAREVRMSRRRARQRHLDGLARWWRIRCPIAASMALAECRLRPA